MKCHLGYMLQSEQQHEVPHLDAIRGVMDPQGFCFW